MIPWLDFIVCALMGWTGIHKFKERKVALGTLYFLTVGLCGVGWIVDTVRYLVIAVRRTSEINGARTKRLPEDSELPVVSEPELLELKAGEVCHYEQNAACVSARAVKERENASVVIRVDGKMPLTVQPKKTVSIDWRKTEELLGRLYVTDRRVVISDGEYSSEYLIDRIGRIELYRNLIILNVQNQKVYLATDEAAYVYQIIARVYRKKLNG